MTYSYSLLASKRKFDRLLEQISNPTHSQPTASQNGNLVRSSGNSLQSEPKSKRQRTQVDPTASRSARRSTLVQSTPRLAFLLSKQAQQKRTSASVKTPPSPGSAVDSFAPSSQPAFLARLKSFNNVRSWSTKPAAINEVQWAKRGWRLIRPETVSCDTCHAMLVIDIAGGEQVQEPGRTGDLDEATEVAETRRESVLNSLSSKYADKIVSEHLDGCPWARLGCKDSIYHVHTFPPSASVQQLSDRYERLLKSRSLPVKLNLRKTGIDMTAALKAFDQILFPTTRSSEDFATQSGSDASRASRSQALALALCGWDTSQDHPMGSYVFAECHMCFRRVGLWLFAATSEDQETTLDDGTSLDILAEHRVYCPWVNASTQNPLSSHDTSHATAMECLLQNLVYLASSTSQPGGDETGGPEKETPSQPTATPGGGGGVSPPKHLRTNESQVEETPSSPPEDSNLQHSTESKDVEAADRLRNEKLLGLKTFFSKLYKQGALPPKSQHVS